MTEFDLRNQLCKLNVARMGSFGELVFEAIAVRLGKRIESQRNQSTDFRLEGFPVDVKTTLRRIDKSPETIKHTVYNGRRLAGIEYARVEFFTTGARVSLENEVFAFINWADLQDLWLQWNKKRRWSEVSGMRSQSKERMQPIEDELVAFFAGRGLSLRIPILYRVKRFDKSPHNLKPGPRKQHFDLTVYIDFHDDNIARDNILRITAFPHACIDELQIGRAHV